MSEPIITVSGFRGIVGDSITSEMAIRYAAAFVDGLPDGKIVLSRDSRTTGPMLADAVRSALCAVGRTVIDAGIAATPTTGILVQRFKAAGGIQISASHNPAQYNGIKLFNSAGSVLPEDVGATVAERYRSGAIPWVAYQDVGRVEPCADTMSEHEALVLAIVDVDQIRDRRFRILLDINHGAAGPLAQRLLDKLGCQVTVLGAEPNGEFLHLPEPTEKNLREVSERARDAAIDVCFCPDPDGDRLAVLDENGRYIGEEFTLALCVDHVLRVRPGPIVTNNSTSRMSEDLAKRYGVPFFRSPVGEPNVVEAMHRQDAVFGGEGNGGPIDPRVGYVRDSFVGIAVILDAMASRQMTISQLVSGMPQYEIRKQAISFDPAMLPSAVSILKQVFENVDLDDTAGYRFVWENKWLLLRRSNTEPIVRIIAEADSAAEAEAICRQTVEVLQGLQT